VKAEELRRSNTNTRDTLLEYCCMPGVDMCCIHMYVCMCVCVRACICACVWTGVLADKLKTAIQANTGFHLT